MKDLKMKDEFIEDILDNYNIIMYGRAVMDPIRNFIESSSDEFYNKNKKEYEDNMLAINNANENLSQYARNMEC